MTLKRIMTVALVGVALAALGVGIVTAGTWVQIGGRWFYTPDIGSSVTITRLPNTSAQAFWTLETARYGFACLNPAGNQASETVMVRDVMFMSSVYIPQATVNKQKGKAFVSTHFDTDSLGRDEDCVNPNWQAQVCGPKDDCEPKDPLGDTVLVYEFTGNIIVKTCSGTDPSTCNNTVSQQKYACTLPGGYSPLNLPPQDRQTDYECNLVNQ